MLDAAGPTSSVSDFFCNATGCRAFCTDTDCEVQALCANGVKVTNGNMIKSENGKWGNSSRCPEGTEVLGLAKVELLEPIGNENLDRWDCDETGCKAWCYGSDCNVMTRCLAVDSPDQVAGLWETKRCCERPCPVDCLYGAWGLWSQCTKSCEVGEQTRSRKIQVEALNGGRVCSFSGPPLEKLACNAQACPIDCVWSDWGEFEDCSASCSPVGGPYGQRVKRRIIARQAKDDGAECVGTYEMSHTCGQVECPVDCQFGAWQGWGDCLSATKGGSEPVTCGGDGSRNRLRIVMTKASNGGRQCEGKTTEIDDNCASAPCPVDCVFDTWTQWSTCSQDCGPGIKTRFRSPTVPQLYNGKPCSGSTNETTRCVIKMACAEDPEKFFKSEGREHDKKEEAGSLAQADSAEHHDPHSSHKRVRRVGVQVG